MLSDVIERVLKILKDKISHFQDKKKKDKPRTIDILSSQDLRNLLNTKDKTIE